MRLGYQFPDAIERGDETVKRSALEIFTDRYLRDCAGYSNRLTGHRTFSPRATLAF